MRAPPGKESGPSTPAEATPYRDHLARDDDNNPAQYAPRMALSPATCGDIPAQLRRRRAASRRCEELTDGRRDPIDRPKPRRAVSVRAVGKHSVEFDGPQVFEGIRHLGLRSMRSRYGGGWLVPQANAEDLMCWLEAISGQRLDVTF